MSNDLQRLEQADMLPHYKKMKKATITMFVLTIISFAVSSAFYIFAFTSKKLTMALMLIFLFAIPMICILLSIASLIVSSISLKKFKKTKIFTVLNALMIAIQVIYIIAFFLVLYF